MNRIFDENVNRNRRHYENAIRLHEWNIAVTIMIEERNRMEHLLYSKEALNILEMSEGKRFIKLNEQSLKLHAKMRTIDRILLAMGERHMEINQMDL